MGLNVTIPDTIPEPAAAPAPSAPEPSSAGTEIHVPSTPQDLSSGTPGTQAPTVQELMDLDKHERFRWQGREWDRKELADGYLRQGDYTKKSQALAETRKYTDNFRHDLAKVVSDRSLVSEFKRLYPKEWHDQIDGILEMLDAQSPSQTGQATGMANANPQPGVDLNKQIEKALNAQVKPLLNWKEQMDAQAKETQKQANLATLNQWEEELQKKYPFADMEKVEARAEILIAQDPEFRLDKGKFEKLCKDAHGESEKRYAEYTRLNNKKQQAASDEAKDIGAGGATPGNPPPPVNTMKQAKKALFDSLEQQQ